LNIRFKNKITKNCKDYLLNQKIRFIFFWRTSNLANSNKFEESKNSCWQKKLINLNLMKFVQILMIKFWFSSTFSFLKLNKTDKK
jgi:hypothetical protein